MREKEYQSFDAACTFQNKPNMGAELISDPCSSAGVDHSSWTTGNVAYTASELQLGEFILYTVCFC